MKIIHADMLHSLQIKDYALIKTLNVEFDSGLNIITGETGAGKSILLGALGLILGVRAQTDIIRKGAVKSIVEAEFDISGNGKVAKILEKYDLDLSDRLIIRREISQRGSNRSFINDTPVQLGVVKEIGDLLVDIHGQHEHQSLLKVDNHITMLDEIGGYDNELEEYGAKKHDLDSKIADLNKLKEREKLLKEKYELFSFQIKEIDEVDPLIEEEEKLLEELNILENAEKLVELSSSAYSDLYDNESSVYDSLVNVQQLLIELSSIDKNFKEKEELMTLVIEYINDIAGSVRSYRDKIEIDPTRLEEIRTRLGLFNLLKKKYGGTIEKVLEYRDQIKSELELAENFSERIEKLESEISELRIKCGEVAAELSDKRKKAAALIGKQIEDELIMLGVENSIFDVRIEQENIDSGNYVVFDGERYKAFSNGFDKVEFFISTNIGEDPKPLARIASGGEISRIMLALKTILAKSDKLPLLVFDEIDVGVSGRIAQMVGKSLKSLARYHQIIAITHLPQIAGFAEHHYYVEKSQRDGRVISVIKKLDNEERVKEIAKLLGGERITQATLESAKELMETTVN